VNIRVNSRLNHAFVLCGFIDRKKYLDNIFEIDYHYHNIAFMKGGEKWKRDYPLGEKIFCIY